MLGDTPRSGVIDPGAGEISTRGPVHFDRRATTSARSSRSANEAFGWDLICRHASSHGIFSCGEQGLEGVSTLPESSPAHVVRDRISEAEVEEEMEEEEVVAVAGGSSGASRPQSPGFPQQPTFRGGGAALEVG